MAMDAFDLAERFQTPVFVMTDLDLGMNNWMADPFPYPDKPLDRGKVLRSKDELEAHLAKFKEFARYRDVDGDGIPYRTLPGILDTPGAAYFTRGSGHNERADYTERPDDYKNNMDRLERKLETAKAYVPKPVVSGGPAPGRRHRLRLLGLRRRGGARAPRPARASRPTTCACAPFPSRRKPRPSSPPTTASTSSSRTATGRCTTCCASKSARTPPSFAPSATTTASPSTPKR